MTNDANQGGGMAYRLGWVLYWICLALVPAWIVAPLLSSSVDRYLAQETDAGLHTNTGPRRP